MGFISRKKSVLEIVGKKCENNVKIVFKNEKDLQKIKKTLNCGTFTVCAKNYQNFEPSQQNCAQKLVYASVTFRSSAFRVNTNPSN